MRTTIRACLAVLIGVLLAAGSAWAGFIEVGSGFRAVGMGQAQAGAATDNGAVTYNPAALVQAREHWELDGKQFWLQLGQVGYYPALTQNGQDMNYWFIKATAIGALIPLGKRITIGVNMIIPNDIILDAVLIEAPGFWRFRSPRSPQTANAIGVKITDKFSIGFATGGALNFNASPITLDLSAILAGLGLELAEPNVDINPHIEVDVISGSGYFFGGLYRPFKWLSLGASYQYRGGVQQHLPVYLPPGLLPETTLIIEGSAGEQPSRMIFGAGIFPNENLTIAFDMVYSLWSLTNQWLRTRAVGELIESSDFPDITLKDTLDPRFGVEWADNMRGKYSRIEYALRGGYSFTHSAFPPASEESRGVDNDAHIISGGFALGYRPKKRMQYIGIEYFYEYVDLVERSHHDIRRNPSVIVSDGYVIYYGAGITVKL